MGFSHLTATLRFYGMRDSFHLTFIEYKVDEHLDFLGTGGISLGQDLQTFKGSPSASPS